MKNFKKMAVAILAVVVITAMSMVPMLAQTASPSGTTGSGSITIQNAAKGETYSIYKLFDATLGTSGAIAYYGPIPADLTAYFKEAGSGTGYVEYTGSGTDMPTEMRNKLQEWANKETPLASTVSDGSVLQFVNLPYGYYVVKSSQGTVVSVDSTNPHVTIYDKNTKIITAEKTVENTSYSIGDTIAYTAVFATTNFYGTGSGSQQITKYVIMDTLPEFLDDVEITSITIKDNAAATSGTSITGKEFSSGTKSFELDWVDASGSSLYKNGSIIEVKYTATLTDIVKFDGDGNENTISIHPYHSGTEIHEPESGSWHDSAVVYTFGTALVKTDENSGTLAGAEFEVPGLIAKETASGTGVYTVVSYDPSGTTSGTTLKVNADGMLYILGLKSGTTLSITETKAPDGYNKLDKPATLNAQILGSVYTEQSGSWYKDENGNRTESSTSSTAVTSGSYTDLDATAVQVVNKAGSLLPSTGGIGTTIFYVIGGVLVIGAGVLLVTRRRMKAE